MRTPMSGAWQGCDADLWPKDPTQPFPLAVECKKTQGWDFNQIMQGKGVFYDWLQQTIDQSISPSRIPVLVFSANYRQIGRASCRETV